MLLEALPAKIGQGVAQGREG